MIIDYINTLVEFAVVFLVFTAITNSSPRWPHIAVFSVLSLACSVLFVLEDPPILWLNIALYCVVQVLAFFHVPLLKRLFFSAATLLITLNLEFCILSFVPESLLQTNLGNCFTSFPLLIFCLIVFFVGRKKQWFSQVPKILFHYWIPVLALLLFSAFLGQIYLSRLAAIWSFLPGFVSLLMIAALCVCLILTIKHDRSNYQKQSLLYQRSLNNSEKLLSEYKMQVHNSKAHVRHIMAIINSSKTLEDAKLEINQYDHSLQNSQSIQNQLAAVDSPLLRAVLYDWYTRCQKNSITFDLNSTPMLPSFSMPEPALVEVLDVLFTNAEEHVLTLPEERRLISVRMEADSKLNRILISNPTSDSFRLKTIENHISTKGVHRKGIGLLSAEKICRENKVSLQHSYDPDSSTILFWITSFEDAS